MSVLSQGKGRLSLSKSPEVAVEGESNQGAQGELPHALSLKELHRSSRNARLRIDGTDHHIDLCISKETTPEFRRYKIENRNGGSDYEILLRFLEKKLNGDASFRSFVVDGQKKNVLLLRDVDGKQLLSLEGNKTALEHLQVQLAIQQVNGNELSSKPHQCAPPEANKIKIDGASNTREYEIGKGKVIFGSSPNFEKLCKARPDISVVCNLQLERDDNTDGVLSQRGITYKDFRTKDHDPPVKYFRDFLKVLDAARQNGETLYVHCHHGQGRAGTLEMLARIWMTPGLAEQCVSNENIFKTIVAQQQKRFGEEPYHKWPLIGAIARRLDPPEPNSRQVEALHQFLKDEVYKQSFAVTQPLK